MATPRKELLEQLYVRDKRSVKSIAVQLQYSESGVNYLLKKYRIQKRSISDALYLKHNPGGDPFEAIKVCSLEDMFLFGLGIGLYWGEGNKRNNSSIRLGNSDPGLIKTFIDFLERIYQIKRDKLRFGLQIFSDVSSTEAVTFWSKNLAVPKNSFQKVIITPVRGVGTYKIKSKYGVLTVYFHNKKLRDILCGEIEKLRRVG